MESIQVLVVLLLGLGYSYVEGLESMNEEETWAELRNYCSRIQVVTGSRQVPPLPVKGLSIPGLLQFRKVWPHSLLIAGYQKSMYSYTKYTPGGFHNADFLECYSAGPTEGKNL